MQTAQGNMLVSLNAVDEFLTDHAAVLGGVITTGARGKLKQAIADLIALRSDQTGGVLTSRISTQSKASHRKALMRDHMAPLARIAKSEHDPSRLWCSKYHAWRTSTNGLIREGLCG